MPVEITCSDCGSEIAHNEDIYCESCGESLHQCAECRDEICKDEYSYCQACYSHIVGEKEDFENNFYDAESNLKDKISECEDLEDKLYVIEEKYDNLVEFLKEEYPDALMAYSLLTSNLVSDEQTS